ncbi:MAG: DUF177 domain-containing protein [Clostridia bacterium]|nr:DUF177 domain-containing protein [Clostridia bacterium]
MIIDIKKLKQSGKDECSFHFETEMEDEIITLPNAKFLCPVSITGTLTLSGRSVFVEGEIAYKLDALCSRCLASTVYEGVVEFDEEFTEDKTVEDAYIYSRGLVDLSEMTREKVILSMPLSVLCREDCKGICPSCGANLNETKCNCNKE